MKIVVVDYGAGNVYSVLSAIRRLGYQAVVSGEAAVMWCAYALTELANEQQQ